MQSALAPLQFRSSSPPTIPPQHLLRVAPSANLLRFLRQPVLSELNTPDQGFLNSSPFVRSRLAFREIPRNGVLYAAFKSGTDVPRPRCPFSCTSLQRYNHNIHA